jgi:hypothetical protein
MNQFMTEAGTYCLSKGTAPEILATVICRLFQAVQIAPCISDMFVLMQHTTTLCRNMSRSKSERKKGAPFYGSALMVTDTAHLS